MSKRGLGIDVLTAARERIATIFDNFLSIYVSCSFGKDSTVMMHLVMDEAVKRDRKVGMLFVDLEGQYKLTIDHGLELVDLYKDNINLHWICLPLNLRNAVSQFEPQWTCWEPKKDWVRQPPQCAITDQGFFDFYKYGMEFEDFVPQFGKWYNGDELTGCFVGIRTDESLNRYRTISSRRKQTFCGHQWTTWCGNSLYNAYPIYDWKTEDIWRYHGHYPDRCHNQLYDRMHAAGLTVHQMRICQPYGDDQRKGLHLFHVIEPETWPKILARVNGANQGALYSKDSGNILGNMKISKPPEHTWESFAMMILGTLPFDASEHYKDKIAVFLKWWSERGYPSGIPDYCNPREEATKEVPSWRRICKSLLRNDYWCKGLSFSQHKSGAYEKYKKLMKKRRAVWKLI